MADIDLGGDLGSQNPVATERMLAQFAWTLRQEPGITACASPSAGSLCAAPTAARSTTSRRRSQYDPSGATASSDIYALIDGLLARRDGNELQPTAGPFGDPQVGLRAWR